MSDHSCSLFRWDSESKQTHMIQFAQVVNKTYICVKCSDTAF